MNSKRTIFKPFQTIVILLSITLMIQGAVFLHLFLEELTPIYYTTNKIMYRMNLSEDYSSLRYYLATHTAQEIAENENLSELYAVCLYYENSMYYHAYANVGDTEMAALYLAACQEAAENTGELTICTQKIDTFFN
ncbi:MAG: hypothetical protein R3Y06_10140 [Faecalibacterium sp.]